ncbi:dienelactone hydrolase family protein [Fulvivirga sp. 29W222]|uniref:Dienelactone hydrolase family protein n=1 Tax=Fulvivirga marina TaxID=2494733 RepID=A0A937FZB3_9BACT|nr:dienelactone hydrolase family protein [Fulvivirga marina]MBL6447246.1 dienelactone hydrolase family protein [Fulvivirga marina]
MKQECINFGFEARYFQSAEITADTKQLIFVIHGYGQQAKYFMRKFDALQNNETCIIAPEGLSRFYLAGFSGRVGATWMTKEERLTDIKNYINYLTTIYQKLTSGRQDIKTSIIGFSQGAATASRWAAMSLISFDKLILWAGIFPPDMDFEKASHQFSNKMIYYVYGTDDPFLTKERMDEMKELSKKLGVSPKVISFKGGHDIVTPPLKDIFL